MKRIICVILLIINTIYLYSAVLNNQTGNKLFETSNKYFLPHDSILNKIKQFEKEIDWLHSATLIDCNGVDGTSVIIEYVKKLSNSYKIYYQSENKVWNHSLKNDTLNNLLNQHYLNCLRNYWYKFVAIRITIYDNFKQFSLYSCYADDISSKFYIEITDINYKQENEIARSLAKNKAIIKNKYITNYLKILLKKDGDFQETMVETEKVIDTLYNKLIIDIKKNSSNNELLVSLEVVRKSYKIQFAQEAILWAMSSRGDGSGVRLSRNFYYYYCLKNHLIFLNTVIENIYKNYIPENKKD